MQISRQSLAVGLLSSSVVAIELVWTRLMSAEFFYTFAFLILSLAILGLGVGALFVRLWEQMAKETLCGYYLSLAALFGVGGPIAVFNLGLKFSELFSSWLMFGKLVITVFLLGLPFLFAGMALAIFFRKYVANINVLYMYDLLGAALGALIALSLMNWLGTPAAAFLILIPLVICALLVSHSWNKVIPLLLIAIGALLVGQSDRLMESEREEYAPVIYKHWDAMAKIKLFDFGDEARGINIDNVANTPVYHFDGSWDEDDTTDNDWGIDVSYLIDKFDSCRFLSLGAGGGGDVLQALAEGATDIYAVEVNPHINKMMTVGDSCGYLPPDTSAADEEDTTATDTTAADTTESAGTPDIAPVSLTHEDLVIVTLNDFSGNIYNDPRVTVISEDARTYIRRFKNKFDLIYSLSSNTWAALGSGSFALAENYIFTTEAYRDYWNALSDSGFLSMEHQVYMPRLVSSALDALKAEGVAHPERHIAVYDLPEMRRNLMLISKRELDDSLRYHAYGPLTEDKFEQIHLLYPAADSLADNLINRIVLNGWKAEADSAKIDISPATDDRPFVAQMGLWRNLSSEGLTKIHQWVDFRGFPLSKTIMLIIILIVLIIIIPLNLLPYRTSKIKLRLAPWLYFFLIGLGFMIVEIILIQKYALFIGASIYSIATVLVTLLIASGIGSKFSTRFNTILPFAAIMIWIVLDQLFSGMITSALIDLSILGRAVVTTILIFPIGFFMGMPFPKAAARVGELVDWGFAVNGAASVLGATAIVLFAMEFGFAASLRIGALIYLAAAILLGRSASWGRS